MNPMWCIFCGELSVQAFHNLTPDMVHFDKWCPHCSECGARGSYYDTEEAARNVWQSLVQVYGMDDDLALD